MGMLCCDVQTVLASTKDSYDSLRHRQESATVLLSRLKTSELFKRLQLVCNGDFDDDAALPVRRFASSDWHSMNKRFKSRLRCLKIPSRSRRTSTRYACFPMWALRIISRQIHESTPMQKHLNAAGALAHIPSLQR